MTELISINKIKARYFHSIKRFIDDLCAINDGGEFGRTNAEIYPKELKLPLHLKNYASFLNLDINIVNGKFVYKFYGKKVCFPFFIVRMLHIDSNIPNYIF